jgi:CRISPR-associated protein Cst2
LRVPSRALDVVDAISSLSEVAGNHSRFLYDFSPDAIIYRWTDDFAPRLLYGFCNSVGQRLTIPDILGRIDQGDLDPKEMVVGAATPESFDRDVLTKLEAKGIRVLGIKGAAEEVKKRMVSHFDATAKQKSVQQ